MFQAQYVTRSEKIRINLDIGQRYQITGYHMHIPEDFKQKQIDGFGLSYLGA